MLNHSPDYFRNVYPLVYQHTEHFLCEDGWFDVLDHLGLITNFHLREKNEEIFLLRVKEKYGILFIDYEGVDDLTRSFIGFAERLSRRTCEICGNSGKLYSSEQISSYGKLKTLCKKHALAKLYWKV